MQLGTSLQETEVELNAKIFCVANLLPRRAADRLAERLAAAGKNPRVFYAHVEEADGLGRLLDHVANATFSVVAATPRHADPRASLNEFVGSLAKSGITPEFVGFARDNSVEPFCTPVAILRGNRPPIVEPAPVGFRVGAIIAAYNEEDVITDTVRHLAKNGVGVYLIDNWSTDSTLEQALAVEEVDWLGHERFPADGPSETFEWTRLLKRVEVVASDLAVDWIISNDADEFRYAPWPGVTLRDALFHVEDQGFNAVNHTYLNFELTEDSLDRGNVFEGLTWFRPERNDLGRINAWQHERGRLEDIATWGNHAVHFDGRTVFPYNFLCRHYPMRSLEQATRKVFRDRLPRFLVSERLKGWHSHYDKLSPDTLLRPTDSLYKFDATFDEDFVIERLTGVGFDPTSTTVSHKIRVARVLRRLGVLDRALALRWRLSGRAAK